MHVPSYRRPECEPEVVYAEDIQNTSSGELHVQYNLYIKTCSLVLSYYYSYIHVCMCCIVSVQQNVSMVAANCSIFVL